MTFLRPDHVPPGWDEWYGKLTGGAFYDCKVNEVGEVISYGELQRYTSWDAGRVRRLRLGVNADCRLTAEELKAVLAGRDKSHQPGRATT